MTVSYTPIEIPAEPQPFDPIPAHLKDEPSLPSLPPARDYVSSDARAKALGLWAIELRNWGRGLVAAINQREATQEALYTSQKKARDRALQRLADLREKEG